MTFTSLHENNRRRGRVDPPLESPRQLALVALGIWLVGVLVHPLAVLVPLGLALLLLAGAAYLVRPKKRTMFWRGREIDLDDDSRALDRLYRSVFKN